jgi:hypothetical protein
LYTTRFLCDFLESGKQRRLIDCGNPVNSASVVVFVRDDVFDREMCFPDATQTIQRNSMGELLFTLIAEFLA